MKTVGWMVNLTMRRVEPVVRESSPYNRLDYGKYRGPRRTYMLHDGQVFDTELEAMDALCERMTKRYNELAAQERKYRTELAAVVSATVALTGGQP